MSEDFLDLFLRCFFVLMAFLLACLCAGVLALGVDAVQNYRSFPAQVACQSKRMDVARQTFSAQVVCVPVLTRQDTLTIHHS